MKLASLENVKRFLEYLPEFELKPIHIEGIETKKFKAVCYKGTNMPVAIVSDRYKLVQHRTVFTIALDRILEQVKEEAVKGWIQHTRTKAYFFVTFVDSNITEDSNYDCGLLITNSVNTQLSIWSNIFLYREICSNGLIEKSPILEVQNKHITSETFYDNLKNKFDWAIENFGYHLDRQIKFLIELKDYTLHPSEILKHLEMSKKAFIQITKQLKTIDTLFNIYQAITNYYTNTTSMNIASRVNYLRKAREIIEEYVRHAKGVG